MSNHDFGRQGHLEDQGLELPNLSPFMQRAYAYSGNYASAHDGDQSYQEDIHSDSNANLSPTGKHSRSGGLLYDNDTRSLLNFPGKGFVQEGATEIHSPVGDEKKKAKSAKKRRRFFKTLRILANSWWLMELLSSLIAVVAFGGIIATLGAYNHKPLTTWDFPITLNTLVSLLATLLRSSLITPIREGLGQLKWLWFEQAHTLRDFQAFDKAAKGPLSAASLLVTLGRRPHLAMIGAVLVIAALAIDPFIQQVIDFPSQPIELSSNASIPRATTYGAFNLGSLEEVNAVQSSYGNQLSAAVLAAIYNPDAASLQNSTRLSISDNMSRDGNYSLTGELNVDSDADIMDIVIDTTGDDTASFHDIPATLLFGTITVLSTDNQSGLYDQQNDHHLRDVWAAECALQYCVQIYTSQVVNGVLNESVIDTFYFTNSSEMSTWSQESDGPSIGNSFQALMPHTCISNGTTYALPTNTAPTSLPSLAGLVDKRDAVHAEHQEVLYSVPADCVFTFAQNFSQGVLPVILTNATLGDALTGNMSRAAFMDHFNSTVFNISAGITKTIRQYGFGIPAVGLVTQDQVVINVRWAWLSLPAASIVLGIVFVISTMAKSRRRKHAGVWKSSALPALFHGFDDYGAGDTESLVDIEEVAKDRRVRLGRGRDDRIGFVAA